MHVSAFSLWERLWERAPASLRALEALQCTPIHLQIGSRKKHETYFIENRVLPEEIVHGRECDQCRGLPSDNCRRPC